MEVKLLRKARKLACFDRVADAIGPAGAEYELASVLDQGISIDSGDKNPGSAFAWHETPQGSKFWRSVVSGRWPLPGIERGHTGGSAPDFLHAALSHMQDRAETYDAPQGERSMGRTVTAFNALTGHGLTEEQGWLFMQVLKAARTQQGAFRADNYEDGAAYVALMGEAAAREKGNG